MITFIYEEVRNPDDRAFILELYHRYDRLMYYTANKYCGEPYDREEIVQDTILKLIQKASLLRTLEEKALAAYVVVTVRNMAFSRHRRQAMERNLFVPWEEESESIPDGSMTIEEGIIFMEKKEALLEIWNLLSEEDRFLLEGRYILGYTDQELAQELGCKAAALRMKLTRARRKALKLVLSHRKGGEPL